MCICINDVGGMWMLLFIMEWGLQRILIENCTLMSIQKSNINRIYLFFQENSRKIKTMPEFFFYKHVYERKNAHHNLRYFNDTPIGFDKVLWMNWMIHLLHAAKTNFNILTEYTKFNIDWKICLMFKYFLLINLVSSVWYSDFYILQCYLWYFFFIFKRIFKTCHIIYIVHLLLSDCNSNNKMYSHLLYSTMPTTTTIRKYASTSCHSHSCFQVLIFKS